MSAPTFARAPHSGDGVIEPVGDNAEVLDIGAFAARQRLQCEVVGRYDLAGPRLGSGRHQLVAGGEQRDLRPPMDRQARMIHAGGERKIARGEPVSGREQNVT